MPIYSGLMILVSAFQVLASWTRMPKILAIVFISLIASLFVTNLILPDYESYLSIYSATPNIKQLVGLEVTIAGFHGLYGEPLYTILASLAITFGIDFYFFRFVVVFLSLVLKLWVISRLSPQFSTALIFYFALLFYVDSYLLRHSFAASLVAVGIVELLHRKNVRFLAFVLLAAGFHVSAFVALPLIFFARTRLSTGRALIIILGGFLVGALAPFGAVISQLAEMSDSFLNRAIVRYSLSGYGDAIGLMRGSILLYTGILLGYIALGSRIRVWFVYYYPILSIAVYGLLFIVLLNDFLILADRLFRLFIFVFALIFAATVRAVAGAAPIAIYYGVIAMIAVVSIYVQEGERAEFMRVLF